MNIQSIAQIRISYSIGVVGADFNTSTYSNPLSINGKNCIIVTNGISKFIVSDHGIFLNECAVNQDYIRYSIQVAPNPASSYTIIKFKNKLQVDNNFSLSLFGSNGQLINKLSINQLQLLQGYRLSTAELNDGVYFIQITSSKINQIFRLLIMN
jgi:alpha-tubulin suppressor-like RCC1 family protein